MGGAGVVAAELAKFPADRLLLSMEEMLRPELLGGPPALLLLLWALLLSRLGAIVRRRGSLLAGWGWLLSPMRRSDWEMSRGLPLSKEPKIVAREEESLPGPSMVFSS